MEFWTLHIFRRDWERNTILDCIVWHSNGNKAQCLNTATTSLFALLCIMHVMCVYRTVHLLA